MKEDCGITTYRLVTTLTSWMQTAALTLCPKGNWKEPKMKLSTTCENLGGRMRTLPLGTTCGVATTALWQPSLGRGQVECRVLLLLVHLTGKLSHLSMAMGLINYWSEVTHGRILLCGTMNLNRPDQRKTPGLHSNYTEWTKRLVHWQSVSWNNETSLLILKVNSSMTIITDHLWCIPFCDQRFQYNLLSYIIAYHVWAWFSCKDRRNAWVPSRYLDMSHPQVILQSLSDSLKLLFNHTPDWTHSWSQFGT